MFAATGTAAALATAIIAITAEPAAADPGPVLPLPAVQHVPDLHPGPDRTTESPASQASAAPSTTAPKTSTKTTTGETVRRTKASRPSNAAHQPAPRRAPSPTAAPKLRPAVPSLPPRQDNDAMAEPDSYPNEWQSGDPWSAPGSILGAISLIVAAATALAVARMAKHRPGYAEGLVEGAAYRPCPPGDPDECPRLRPVN